MARRQTIKVSALVEVGNRCIAHARTPEERRAIAAVVSDVLLSHEGAYSGFNYSEWEDGGCDRWHADGEPVDNHPYLGDKTRIRFY